MQQIVYTTNTFTGYCKNIVKIYGFIEEELTSEENYYAEKNPGSSFPYRRMFSEYPYIAAMKKLKDNEFL